MPPTPRLQIDPLTVDQNLAEVTVNDALNRIDVFVHMRFKDRDLSAAPAAVDGDIYLVAGTPVVGNLWFGQGGKIAFYFSGWLFLTPVEGMRAWVDDEDIFIIYNGVSWSALTGGAGGAPTTASYVVLALDATLTNERVLVAGSMLNLTDTGPGGGVTVAVSANPTVPGQSHILVPFGPDASRTPTPANGMVRYNTQSNKFEGYENGAWIQMVSGTPSDGLPTKVYKTADQTIIAPSASPENDSMLQFAVLANTKYSFQIVVYVNIGGGSQVHQLSWSAPSGLNQFRCSFRGPVSSPTTVGDIVTTDATSVAAFVPTSSGDRALVIEGIIETGVNAGTVILRHEALVGFTNAIVRRGSHLFLWKH